MLHFVGSPCILKRAKYAMTDGGGTATHSEAKSGADGLDPSWILLEQLAVLKRERKLRRAVTFFSFCLFFTWKHFHFLPPLTHLLFSFLLFCLLSLCPFLCFLHFSPLFFAPFAFLLFLLLFVDHLTHGNICSPGSGISIKVFQVPFGNLFHIAGFTYVLSQLFYYCCSPYISSFTDNCFQQNTFFFFFCVLFKNESLNSDF